MTDTRTEQAEVRGLEYWIENTTDNPTAALIQSLHARVKELEAVHAAITDLDGNDVIRIAGTVGISVHHDDGYPDHDRLQQLIDFVRIAAHGITQEKQG